MLCFVMRRVLKKKIRLDSLLFILKGTNNAQGTTYTPTPLDDCQLIGGYLTNPYWVSKPSKLYTKCQGVKVGIETANPTHGLHVATNTRLDNTLFVGYGVGIGAEAEDYSSLYIFNKRKGAAIHIDQGNNANDYSKLLYLEYSNPTTEVMNVKNTVTGTTAFLFHADGSMLVNNGQKDIFKLYNGGVLKTREIILDAISIWPDFVFDENYVLPSLSELKKYIAINKHLPNVPSASEILETGIPIAEMNTILLEKVEQLTLYLIEQQERITALEERLNSVTK